MSLPVFKVEPLSLTNWLLVLAFTSSVLVFAEISRLIRRARPSAAPAVHTVPGVATS